MYRQVVIGASYLHRSVHQNHLVLATMVSVACSLQKPALVVRQAGPTRVAQRQAVRVMAHKQEHKVMPPAPGPARRGSPG